IGSGSKGSKERRSKERIKMQPPKKEDEGLIDYFNIITMDFIDREMDFSLDCDINVFNKIFNFIFFQV
ncbi:hypothetical protein LCGC14_2732180, partial [marine sediment metagenome]